MAEVKLAEESVLTDDFLRQLIDVGEVDILVGVPTHNNAKTIGPIVETIQAGILKFFPRERAAIINADGGSRDGTPKLQAIRPPDISLHQHAVCEQSGTWDSAADDHGRRGIIASQGLRCNFARVHSNHSRLAHHSPASHLHGRIRSRVAHL
jgi:hypothetical protein